ncbi:unnamed protein product [Cunninghamella blakesleeana]
MTESISQTQLLTDTNRFGSSSLGSRSRSLASYNNNNSSNNTTGSMNIKRRSSSLSLSSTSSISSTNTIGTITNSTSTNSNNNNTSNTTIPTATVTTTTTNGTFTNNINNSAVLSSSSIVYTIVLKPLNNQFPTKTLEVTESMKCKIGRQSNAKTIPKPLNGYFNSKVLSRSHALLWLQDNQVWIKDTKSSNGTFLNGKRLSPELEESEAFEIKTGDHIEFGIDITGEDGLVLYHKVACDISVFNIPLNQIDYNTLQKFNISTGNSSQRKLESNGSQERRDSSPLLRRVDSGTFRYSSTLTSASSSDSLSVSLNNDSTNNRTKNWDVVLAKLESELQRSQQVEKELMDMKGAINDANKYYSDEKNKKTDSLNLLLQKQLYEAQHKIKEYTEKSKLQEQAMSSAQKQLLQLQKTIEKTKKNHHNGMIQGSDVTELRKELEQLRLQLDEEKISHNKELMVEKQKCMDYEEKCLQLEKRILLLEKSKNHHQQSLIHTTSPLNGNESNGFFTGFLDALQLRSVQILLGILLAIISALFYALLAI